MNTWMCWADRTPTSTSDRMGGRVLDAVPDVQALRGVLGGTSDPLIISWPKGIKSRGEIRNQYHHSTDIVPTILEIAGLEMPKVYHGVEQYPLNGVSMRYTFDAKPDDPTRKKRQYYAMLGTRGIWEDGWLAAAVHPPISGKGHFDQDCVAALSRGRRSLRVEGPRAGEPRQAPGAHQGVDGRSRQEPGSAPSTTAARLKYSAPNDLPRKPPREVHLLSRHGSGPRRCGRQRARAVLTRSLRHRNHRCQRLRRDLCPRVSLRAAIRSSSRIGSCTTCTTSSASSRRSTSCRRRS